MKIQLSKILEGLEFQNGENAAYLNRRTGEVVLLTEEMISAAENEEDPEDFPAWEREVIALAKKICLDESPDYIQLPDRFEIDEYRMMKDFVGSAEDPDQQRQLARSIQGGGAFRRFKDTAFDLGLLEAWYAYRNEEYKRLAMEWCQEKEIEFE